MRILISGGGIAGPALAHALSALKTPHQITILERAPALRSAGQQVDVRGVGLQAATRLGLLPSLRNLIVKEEGFQVVDKEGVVKAFFPGGEEGKERLSPSAEYELMRGDVCKMLAEKTEGKGNVQWEFGKTVQGWEEDASGGVRVKLDDGGEETYDLLVAADGQGSRVRRTMLSKAGARDHNRNLGVTAAYFSMQREPSDKPVATLYQAPGGYVYSTRWHSPTKGQGYLLTMSKDDKLAKAMNGGTLDDKKAVFAEMFQGRGWQSDRIVKAMQESDDVYMSETIQVKSEIWSHNGVILLGDAGYCPSPLTGMGTSLALIGSYILAGEISLIGKEHDNLSAALDAYETKLRPFVEKTQELPSFVPRVAYPESKIAIWLTQNILGVAAWLRLDKIALKFVATEKNTWELPRYPELEDVLKTEDSAKL